MLKSIHCIMPSPALKQQVHDFKAYTAQQIIAYLRNNKAEKILKTLAFYKKAHKTDSQFQVWEEGSHSQLLQNEDMLLQKIQYIHNNPVKRGYVDNARVSFPRSSVVMRICLQIRYNLP